MTSLLQILQVLSTSSLSILPENAAASELFPWGVKHSHAKKRTVIDSKFTQNRWQDNKYEGRALRRITRRLIKQADSITEEQLSDGYYFDKLMWISYCISKIKTRRTGRSGRAPTEVRRSSGTDREMTRLKWTDNKYRAITMTRIFKVLEKKAMLLADREDAKSVSRLQTIAYALATLNNSVAVMAKIEWERQELESLRKEIEQLKQMAGFARRDLSRTRECIDDHLQTQTATGQKHPAA